MLGFASTRSVERLVYVRSVAADGVDDTNIELQRLTNYRIGI